MVIKQNYDLKIAIDVGYSASKICVNGVELFTIPSDIVELTGENEYLSDIHRPGYICTSYVKDQKHLVGAQASTLLLSTEYREKFNEIRDTMLSYNRFFHNDAHIHLMTCIGMALIKYSEHTIINNIQPVFDVRKDLGKNSLFNIYVILGYPHDEYKRIFQTVKPNLAKEHEFSIVTEDNKYDLKFDINPKHVMTYSQALAAYMGVILDNNGVMQTDSPHFQKLPALLIDGGWKTLGKFELTKDLKIERAESNVQFAMKNVYEKINEVLRNEYGRDDFQIYNIEEILKNENGMVTSFDKATNKTSRIDIKPLYFKFRDEVCEKMIQYLNEKHNNLLDVKEIIIAGGTGAAYYDYFMDYIHEQRDHISDSIYLVNDEFNGVKIDPVYAVVVGLYKVLLNAMDAVANK